ncbi:MAG: choice-of-anchor J domain-containing protein, partial [Chitinophagaceae bacterium]|nr:choice-of-anchor J domain-containing protein [Chitinophagaceae bacterium]
TWATSLAGTLNTNTCRFTAASPAKSFTSGLTYTFTPPACAAPGSLSAGSVTTTSASISFGGAGTAFILEYGAPGFTPGTDNNAGGGTIVTGSASPIAISGLTANTTYDVYVRQDCTGDGNGYSPNSAKATFTTACDAVSTYPYSEGFNAASLPACWTAYEGAPGASQHWQPVTADATHGAGASAEGSHFLRMNYYNASTTYNPYYLKSLSFDLGATAKRAKFAIWMGSASGTNNLKFEISTDGGGTWTTLETYTANPANSSSSAPWDSKTVDLSSYTNQTVIFRLNATSNFGSGYCNIGFDNFVVEDLPACAEPTGLSAGSVTNNAASISFTSGGNNFILEYGAAGFTPGTDNNPGVGGTIVTGSASPIAVSSLTANTTYDVYVRQDCGGGVYSPNSSKATFTTACDVVSSYPWTENFNSVTTPALPSCFSAIDANSDGDKWITYTTYGVGGSICAGLYTDFNSGANNDYLVLPAFNLTGNQRLSFAVSARSAGEPNDYRVVLSTTGNDASDFTTVLKPLTTVSNTTMTNIDWKDLSSYTGIVYIAIHVPSGGLDGYYLYVDDIVVEDMPACAEPSGLSMGSITNNAASASFTGGGSAFIVEYGAPGFTPGTDDNAGVGGTIVTGSASPIAISGLTANTTYDVYVRQDCTGDGNGYSP